MIYVHRAGEDSNTDPLWGLWDGPEDSRPMFRYRLFRVPGIAPGAFLLVIGSREYSYDPMLACRYWLVATWDRGDMTSTIGFAPVEVVRIGASPSDVLRSLLNVTRVRSGVWLMDPKREWLLRLPNEYLLGLPGGAP